MAILVQNDYGESVAGKFSKKILCIASPVLKIIDIHHAKRLQPLVFD